MTNIIICISALLYICIMIICFHDNFVISKVGCENCIYKSDDGLCRIRTIRVPENTYCRMKKYNNKYMEEFVSSGCKSIEEERKRQIEVEHYTVEHDKNELIENLIWAATAYATGCRRFWPWDIKCYKPGDLSIKGVRKDLVRAGALIAAAIDKIDRGETAELEP